MDLNDLKLSNTNILNISDSLKAPLLKLNIKPLTNNMEGSTLEVYVDPSITSNEERKTYVFDITSPLRVVDSQSDEFIIEPVYDGKNITMQAYVLRKSNGGVLLATPLKEEVDETGIILFEGNNIISTNYTNVEIEVIYPKDEDLVKLFLNTAFYALKNDNKVLSLDDIYFKDCFTETEQGINAEVNKLTIKCLNSTNGNFTLDCDGNLVVNSITTNVPMNGSQGIDFDSIYPVGSVYLSVNDIDPGTLFTGTWERITGYYLYAGNGGTTSGNNTTSGPSTNATGSTALTIAQMPSHTHTQNAHYHGQNANVWMNTTANVDGYVPKSGTYPSAAGTVYNTGYATATNQNTGGGQGHTHTLNNHTHTAEPLRMELYCYKRVA